MTHQIRQQKQIVEQIVYEKDWDGFSLFSKLHQMFPLLVEKNVTVLWCKIMVIVTLSQVINTYFASTSEWAEIQYNKFNLSLKSCVTALHSNALMLTDVQIMEFCLYWHFTSHPNFIGIGVVTPRYIWLSCSGCTYMFNAMGHGVSAGAPQGKVQHHNLISRNESSDTHNKDQVPVGDIIKDLSWAGDSRCTRHKHRAVSAFWLTCRWEGQREMSLGPSEQ